MLISISECKFLSRVEGEISRVKVNMSRVTGNKLCLGFILYILFSNILRWSHIIIHFLYLLFNNKPISFFFSIWSQDFPSFSN